MLLLTLSVAARNMGRNESRQEEAEEAERQSQLRQQEGISEGKEAKGGQIDCAL